MSERLDDFPAGAWVVAEPQHRRFRALAVWSGVRYPSLGPAGILAQRWFTGRRALGTCRVPMRFVRLAERSDFVVHGVPLGRPAFRVVWHRGTVGPYFVPLRN